LQKSLPGSKAARGLTPHDEEGEEAVAGDGETRTSAASAHAGMASRTGETTGGHGLRAAEALGWGAHGAGEIPSAVWVPEIFSAADSTDLF
jgi:hypothetical protein